jgi:hypothetical protein
VYVTLVVHLLLFQKSVHDTDLFVLDKFFATDNALDYHAGVVTIFIQVHDRVSRSVVQQSLGRIEFISA